ncbi:MAG TPA: sulfatase atsG [Rhodopirellula sp.]|nr:sulfatase atsG [Rhodopirellula sp.]
MNKKNVVSELGRKSSLRWLALAGSLVFGCSALLFGTSTSGAESPNFIFILADDCSYRDLELYGGAAKTPHINRLANSGLTFQRCYQAAPMCSPTRHALYTGLYPVRSGAYPNHAKAYENVKSIPHYLSEAGYRVALAGKTHVSPKSVFPFEYINEFADPPEEDVPVVDGWRYHDVLHFMQESADSKQPFCLFLCSNEPHAPYSKGDPKPYRDAKLSPQQFDFQRGEYARYLAEITYFDGQVGEVAAMVKHLGLKEETCFVVATEQGSGFPFGKWTCYEIGVASGLVVSWPGVVKQGGRTDAIVEYTDVLPTFLDAADLAIPDALEGRSFLRLLQGKTTKHSDYAFSIQTTQGVTGYRQPYGIRTVVGKQYRYIRNLFPENEFSIPVSRSVNELTRGMDEKTRSRAMRYMKRPAEELYDVIADPYCQNNLAGEEDLNVQKQQLASVLERWMRDQGDTGRQVELEAHGRQADWYKPKIAVEK